MQTAVDLVPQAAHSGRLGVRLAVAPLDPKNPPAAIESPPVLFSSPAVQVEAGQIVCIHGWVRVPAAVTASTDGLLIVDSLSGECLADRIGRTKGWRSSPSIAWRRKPGRCASLSPFPAWAKHGSTTWKSRSLASDDCCLSIVD